MSNPPFSDDKFKRLLTEGYGWQMKLGQWLLEEGLTIYVPPLRWRKTYKDAASFKDDQDIVVGSGKKVWLEVKSTTNDFKGPDDLRYPIRLVTTSSWRKLEEKPLGIAIISKPTSQVIFAPTKFESDWEVREIHDRLRGFKEDWLVARREHIFSYGDLVTVLKVRTDERKRSP